MGKLKLPDPSHERAAQPKRQVAVSDPLAAGDTIDYGLTVEVSAGPGQKAWVKFGTTSSVREGETTQQARSRVTDYVNQEIDRRIEELS